MTVVGIDLSLTSTGLARLHLDGGGSVHTITSTGKKTDTLAMRSHRLRKLAGQILEWVGDSDHVVIEAAAYSQGAGGHTWDRAGLWWAVVQTLTQRDIPVCAVAPSTRAKWATGVGRSDKAAVGAAMARLLPDIDCRNSDEADALALAHLGAVTLGYRVPSLSGRHSAIPAALSGWAA